MRICAFTTSNMHILLEPDANDGGASSTPPTGEQAASPAVKTEEVDPRAELNARLAEIVKEHGSEETPDDGGEADVKLPEEDDKVVDEVEEEKGEETQEETDPEAPVPFHEHPRWKEQQAKLAEASEELKAAKPVVERMQKIENYCSRFNITEEQFAQALEMAALLNNDPALARERLAPTWEALSRYSGEVLPPDLAQKVKDAVIDKETAQEVAKLRAQSQLSEKRQQITAQQAAEARQQAISQAVVQWEQQKLVADPDYKNKAEEVADRFIALANQAPPRSTSEAVALADRALADVNKRRAARVQTPVNRPAINGKSVKPKLAPPQTALEAAQRAAARHM